jgi:AraC-like DNA-binding protein
MLQISAAGAGSAALLTRLAALMFTASLRSHPQCLRLFKSSEWSDPIAHALHLIGSEPSAEWSVALLAHKVGMGRSSFAARFAAQIGRTPMELITERRMQYAAELLQQGELKIAEISARAGYRSEAAFSRRFTCYFGMSPGTVRRNSQLNDAPEAADDAGAEATLAHSNVYALSNTGSLKGPAESSQSKNASRTGMPRLISFQV